MPRYNSDKRRSEFSYYLGSEGAALFASRSENARRGILTRLANELAKVVATELVSNERFATDLKTELGSNFGKSFLFDTKSPQFSWVGVAEIVEMLQASPVSVQLFKSLIARNLIRRDGQRRYMNSVPYRAGSQEKSTGLEVRGLIRVKGDNPIALQSKSTFVTIVGSKGASSVATRTGVLHLPSGGGRKITARPKTK